MVGAEPTDILCGRSVWHLESSAALRHAAGHDHADEQNGLPEEPFFRFVSSSATETSHLLGTDLTFGSTRQHLHFIEAEVIQFKV